MNLNRNHLLLEGNYIFAEISNRVKKYRCDNPKARLISLGIGDVTLPISEVVVKEMERTVRELGEEKSFVGYGASQGQFFLRNRIKEYYQKRKIQISEDEIFISDGAKSDISNLIELFAPGTTVLLPDPGYPVYYDTNVMYGNRIKFMDMTEENNFLPEPKENLKADIIYICSPNNPTGAVYNKLQLKKWVDFANENESIILFDAAYEAFVSNHFGARSIYEVEGAERCAIEVCSFSKTAGFTGVRCGYTIIPKELKVKGISINKLWERRQNTKFNGASYISQRGASAVFSEQGQRDIIKNIGYYKGNASIIAKSLTDIGIKFIGGENSPYIWLKCPEKMNSWKFFEIMLHEMNIVGTPGVGFGKNGEGYMRLTAFGNREDVEEAANRIKDFYK